MTVCPSLTHACLLGHLLLMLKTLPIVLYYMRYESLHTGLLVLLYLHIAVIYFADICSGQPACSVQSSSSCFYASARRRFCLLDITVCRDRWTKKDFPCWRQCCYRPTEEECRLRLKLKNCKQNDAAVALSC